MELFGKTYIFLSEVHLKKQENSEKSSYSISIGIFKDFVRS